MSTQQSAQIIPFPNAVADLLEHYAKLARVGVVKGVVIAATTAGPDTLLAGAGVDDRDVAALITDLQDARILRLINGEE